VADKEIPDEVLAAHWHDIVSATVRLHRLLDDELEAVGVQPQWYPALEVLLRADGHRLPMSTLARELAITSGGLSKLADRMAAEGLIDRRGTTDDRRVVRATLTEEGLRVARRARAAYVQALRRRLLGAADAAQLNATAETLRTLAAKNVDDAHEVSELVANERDPALPDRRGRGRTSDHESQLPAPRGPGRAPPR
jgi:DNA-binding MarR family transcriptional regulator